MNTLRDKNINGSSERRRYRRDEDRKTPILKFFNYERGDQSLLNLGQRRLPRFVLILSRQPMTKTSKEPVAGNSLE